MFDVGVVKKDGLDVLKNLVGPCSPERCPTLTLACRRLDALRPSSTRKVGRNRGFDF